MTVLTLRTLTGRPVQILVDQEIGSGAEGVVYPVADSPHVCAKLYSDFTRAAQLGPRMEALTGLSPVLWGGDCPEHLHVAWPRTTLRDHSGQLRGVVVPRIDGTPMLRLLDPGRRADLLDEATWRSTFAVAARVGRLFDMLHGAGVVIGDVSPSNVLVDRHGHVTLLDCDGVQFTDPQTGLLHRGEKFTPEYAAPEVLDGRPLSREHDLFGLGVMICELIMEGQHPFGGVSTAQPPSESVEQNIKHHNNRVTRPDRLVPSADALTAEILPGKILDLIRQCFEEGYERPERRPNGRAWAYELDQAAYQMMGCRYNPRHAYHRSSVACVWCARIVAGYGDHFPPPADWTMPLDAPVRGGLMLAPAPTTLSTYPAPPAPVNGREAAPPAVVPSRSSKQLRTIALIALIALIVLVIIVVAAL
ncbi:protein kinase [Actinoplanes sp. LDG1-06]|uniref:Protein kinase n=1 Tax=Paractinoplanes ovalisporus TaxID=2810368 RepID=A0ABS2AM99_9ACTN|nr:protein kinase [Actinoplanes ovalisporus]MBM2620935.1 protein kinase [Actinoplanes ovalisporus]